MKHWKEAVDFYGQKGIKLNDPEETTGLVTVWHEGDKVIFRQGDDDENFIRMLPADAAAALSEAAEWAKSKIGDAK